MHSSVSHCPAEEVASSTVPQKCLTLHYMGTSVCTTVWDSAYRKLVFSHNSGVVSDEDEGRFLQEIT